MAGKILKAGIRFNDPDLKYISLVFDQDQASCTVDAVMVMQGTEMTVRGNIAKSQWFPIESVEPTRATKTTAKKAVKESK